MNISTIQKHVSLIKGEIVLLRIEKLPSILLVGDDSLELPQSAGVYFVTSKDCTELFYIGKTINLRTRWKLKRNIYNEILETEGWNSTWLKVFKQGDCYLHWLVCPKDLIAIIEIAAIQQLKPKWNQARN